MLIKHIVVFKLQEPTLENLEDAKKLIMGMAGNLEILKDLKVGINVLDNPRAYDMVLESKFDNIEDLKTYATHPVHLPVVEHMRKISTSIVSVDYEI